MVIAAILGGVSSSVLLLILLLVFLKRKKNRNGYSRLELKRPSFLLTEARKPSRAKSCFDVLGSVCKNGNAPEFSIPVTKPKTRPKRTCQFQFSLFYNFHTYVLKVQVICAVNLPRLFGLHSGVLVKVHLLSDDGEVLEKLGKTTTQFRSKNPVFKDFFETKAIPYEKLRQMKISLSLFSFDRFSQGHFVGNADVSFADINLDPMEPAIFWRPIQPKCNATSRTNPSREKGQLIISLRYQEKTGRINVVVMKAMKLVTPKRLLRTDPYVVAKLLRDDKVIEKKRTQPCKGSLNPVWNEPFVFDLRKGKELSSYKFLFEIKSSDVLVPDAFLGKVELCQESSEHWKEMMKKKNYARAMCHDVK